MVRAVVRGGHRGEGGSGWREKSEGGREGREKVEAGTEKVESSRGRRSVEKKRVELGVL